MKYVCSLTVLCLCAAVSSNTIANECPSNWKALHPEWIWCDDFETDLMSSYFEKTGPFNRVSGVGVNSSYGMRSSWTSGSDDAGSLKLAFGLTPSGGGFRVPAGVDATTKFREIYYRVYLKSESGWANGGNSKFTRATSFVGGNWSQAMIAHVWSSGTNNNYLGIDPARCVSGNTVQCVGYNDFSHLTWLGAVTGTIPIFTATNAGKWNCIEVHVRLNDVGQSNGVEEFWIDGHLEAKRTNLNFIGNYDGYGINAIFFENYINNGAPQAQSRYWDNFVVSTQRVGCLGPAVVVPPPQNLRLTE